MAAPTKFTRETRKKIIDALRVGNTRRAAAQSAGISKSLFYEWIEKGEKAKSGEYLDFLDAVTRAEAECEVHKVAMVQKAGQDHKVSTTRTKTKTYREVYLKDDGTPVLGENGKPLQKLVTETETVTTEGTEFDWKADAWWLERRRRDEWGANVRIDVDDEIAKLLAALATGSEAKTS